MDRTYNAVTLAVAGAGAATIASADGAQILAGALIVGSATIALRRLWLARQRMQVLPRPDERPGGALPVWMGRTDEGQWIWSDIATWPHGAVGGESGGGKSAMLRQWLTSLVQWTRPSYLQLAIIDLKRIEFGYLSQAPHVAAVAKTPADALEVLQEASAEVDARLRVLEDAGAVDCAEVPGMGRVLVVVDELAELQGDKEAIALLERISRLGRAPGVHLLLCTQRPDRFALSPAIKANTPSRVAFACSSRTNSEVILDTTDAADLPPQPGHAIWKRGAHLTRLRTPWMSLDQAKRIVAEAAAKAVQSA